MDFFERSEQYLNAAGWLAKNIFHSEMLKMWKMQKRRGRMPVKKLWKIPGGKKTVNFTKILLDSLSIPC